jgi:hypothetical protein
MMSRFLLALGLLVGLARTPAGPPEERPSPEEEMVRRLSKQITPDEESIDFLAKVDLRAMRPGGVPWDPSRFPLSWKPGSPPFEEILAKFESAAGPVHHIALSPDGRTLVTGHDSGTVLLRDAASGQFLRRLRVDRGGLGAIALSPDGRVLAAAGTGFHLRKPERGRIELWEVATGRALAVFGEETRPLAVAFSPDGKELASGGWDEQIHFWDPATGEELRSFNAAVTTTLAFAPDGRMLAQGTNLGAELWSPATGKRLATAGLDPRGGHGAFLAFAPDGKRLLVGNWSDARIWNVAGAKFVGDRLSGVRFHQQQPRTPVAFAPDGRTLAIANEMVQFIEVASGQQRQRFGTVQEICIAYSPDGRLAFTGSIEGSVHVWDVTRRYTERRFAVPRLSARDFDELGRNLRDGAAVRAYVALLALARTPREALWHLRDPAPPKEADADRVRRVIAELDANSFTRRQLAMEGLKKLGEWAVTPLYQALADRPSLEMRRRIEALLKELDPLRSGDQRLLAAHAATLLEHIGSPAARQMLERLIREAPDSDLARDARAALLRLVPAERKIGPAPLHSH